MINLQAWYDLKLCDNKNSIDKMATIILNSPPMKEVNVTIIQ